MAIRSVRRNLVEHRRNESNKDFVKHVTWNESGEDPGPDRHLPGTHEGQQRPGRLLRGRWTRPSVSVVNTKEVAPREFCIKKRDVAHDGVQREVPSLAEG